MGLHYITYVKKVARLVIPESKLKFCNNYVICIQINQIVRKITKLSSELFGVLLTFIDSIYIHVTLSLLYHF